MGELIQTQHRNVWMDWARVIACFMVLIVHSTEPFYFGGEGAQILSRNEALWTAVFNTFVRSCVPLFVVISAWLQLPVQRTTGDFLRRRAVRVVIPFVVWTVVYTLVLGDGEGINFRNLLFNFNYPSAHLWYVYMLIGLYLLMPLLSPWAERVGKRELQFYIVLWLLTTLLQLVRDWIGGAPTVIYGLSGVPRQVLFPLWGESSWNTYGLFYYFSGFIGYMLLGLYMRKFSSEMSWGKTLVIVLPCFAAGYAISFNGFWHRVMASSGGMFPTGGPVGVAVWWETTWCNDTIGVALMTIAWVLLLRKIKSAGVFYNKVIMPVSKASYGMYLCHMLLLSYVSSAICGWLGRGADARLGVWTAPVEITVTAVVSFVCVAAVSVAVQRIPKIGKYIMG
ncbi:MAG: acyltransferase family protein [Alistipes sp.]|nr:acyltransferase family protein [Alistipes sp.]